MLQEMIEAAGGVTPLEFLLRLMNDNKQKLALRIDAARAALPFVHPKVTQALLPDARSDEGSDARQRLAELFQRLNHADEPAP